MKTQREISSSAKDEPKKIVAASTTSTVYTAEKEEREQSFSFGCCASPVISHLARVLRKTSVRDDRAPLLLLIYTVYVTVRRVCIYIYLLDLIQFIRNLPPDRAAGEIKNRTLYIPLLYRYVYVFMYSSSLSRNAGQHS